MSQIRIILDMDEVLVDFIGGVCKLFGITRKQLEEFWVPGEWSIVPPLGEILRDKPPEVLLPSSFYIDNNYFWNNINDAGEKFWLELNAMPWLGEIVELAESFTDDWHIVTSPSSSPSSYSGKVKWLKNYFGEEFNQFAITPHKEIFACENVILIDDRQENVTKFREAGGNAIIFPTRGNAFHKFTDNPLTYVTPILESKINALNIS